MVNHVAGESFLNPFDIDKLRDFNLFALGVWLMSTVLQRASWFGNDTSSAGRTPHEQKMAGVLGSWRNGYAYTMIGLFGLLMLMLLVSTDDSRIFNAAATWVQDVVLPFRKTPPDSRRHIAMLRWASVAVAVFFVVAVFVVLADDFAVVRLVCDITGMDMSSNDIM